MFCFEVYENKDKFQDPNGVKLSRHETQFFSEKVDFIFHPANNFIKCDLELFNNLRRVNLIFLLKLGFPLRAIARNCTELRATVLELRAIVRNCAELRGVYRARDCAQVKSTCVGNPN